jgi:hypothetical protein
MASKLLYEYDRSAVVQVDGISPLSDFRLRLGYRELLASSA